MARNGCRPAYLTNCLTVEPSLCRIHAATHTLRVRLRNKVPTLACGNLEYSEQKNCIQPGYRQRANRYRSLAAPDSMQPLPFPGQMPPSTRLRVHTCRVPMVTRSSLAQ